MMYDFNHGATRKPEDIRAIPFSDRVNRFIDTGISYDELEKREKSKRKYIGASAIGTECLRAVQLEYLSVNQDNFKRKPDPFPAKLLKIFENGHKIEDMVAGWMRLGGFVMETLNPDGGQFGFNVKSINFKGHFDGVIRQAPLPIDLPALWECKGLNQDGYNKAIKNGIKLAYPKYYAQVQVNQMHSGVTSPTVFTIMNKNTCTLHHMLIGHDKEHAERYTIRAQMVFNATKTGRLIKRPYKDQHSFGCRFCNWKKSCWSMRK